MRSTACPEYCGKFGCHIMNADSPAADVFKRMREAGNYKNFINLAEDCLETPYKNIMDARERNIVPVLWFRNFMRKHINVSPRWLLTREQDVSWSRKYYI